MRKLLAIIIGLFLAFTSVTTIADYTIDKGPIRVKSPQDIVLTLSEDPTMKPEVACLVLTMGQFLRSSSPKVNVTLFLKNDGVKLADYETVSSVHDPCMTPQGQVTLEDNLVAFLADNPKNLVNCPICWGSLFGGQEPYYGVLDSNAIPLLLLSADKVIDF
jgi:hypothetical protein